MSKKHGMRRNYNEDNALRRIDRQNGNAPQPQQAAEEATPYALCYGYTETRLANGNKRRRPTYAHKKRLDRERAKRKAATAATQ